MALTNKKQSTTATGIRTGTEIQKQKVKFDSATKIRNVPKWKGGAQNLITERDVCMIDGNAILKRQIHSNQVPYEGVKFDVQEVMNQSREKSPLQTGARMKIKPKSQDQGNPTYVFKKDAERPPKTKQLCSSNNLHNRCDYVSASSKAIAQPNPASITVILEGKPLKANRDIISKHSSVFRALLQSKADKDIVKFDDISWNTFSNIYRWMLNNEEVWKTSNASELHAIIHGAVRLGLPELVKECTEASSNMATQSNSESTNAPSTASNEMHPPEYAFSKQEVEHVKIPNLEKLPSDLFADFNFGELFELLTRDDIGSLSEQDILEKCIKWLHSRPVQNSHIHEEHILIVVRWTLLTNKQLVNFMLDERFSHLAQCPTVQTKLLNALLYKVAVNEHLEDKVKYLADRPRVCKRNYCSFEAAN